MKARAKLGGLRWRLTALVYRDAAKAYGMGMALVLLPLVYLYREWPPWEIRDALYAASPSVRAWLIAAAHALYGLASAPVVRQLLASERLRWWWALPLSGRWWQAVHVRHLVLLDAPWLVAIAYGATPWAAREDPLTAIAVASTFATMTVAGQIALASATDRPWAWRGLALLAWASGAWIAVLLPTWLGAPLAAAALVPAIVRLRRPLPEARARMRGSAGGHPVLALARLGWLAVRRREPIAMTWGIVMQLSAVALVGLALVHVGSTQFDAVRSLQRGMAVVSAMAGTALVLRAVRIIDGDRPLLDSWGIETRHERWARLLLAATGVLPALVIGSVVLPVLHPVGQWWPMDQAIALSWATVTLVATDYVAEARRQLHEPRFNRLMLRTAVAAVLVVGAGTTLVLVPWAALAAWRLPSVQRRAQTARMRFETTRSDDHRN
ncbi:MAG: hypothetical protein AAF799_16505 [Myxococcota bacterium]